VLHRVIGGPAVMRAQLERLIEAAGQPNMTVHVILYPVGVHPALDSIFTVVEFDRGAPGVVYVEGLVGSIYFDSQLISTDSSKCLAARQTQPRFNSKDSVEQNTLLLTSKRAGRPVKRMDAAFPSHRKGRVCAAAVPSLTGSIVWLLYVVVQP
jgi:hypothetical protein